MQTIRVKGDFNKIKSFLFRNRKLDRVRRTLEQYGQKGVDLLRENTPVRTGKTADSWSYEIEYNLGVYTISWNNSNVNNHVNIAMIIDTGHGTGNGAYIRGVNYIEPSLRPLFDALADMIWKEVTE